MEKSLKRVLIMAGGTGGHVFPGLAVASYLRNHGIDVHWLGTKKGLEASVVPAADIPLHCVNIGGVRGKGIKTFITAPFQIYKAVKESREIIKNVDPDAVLGMGGFVSGPGGIAAWLCKRPLIIHEQNAKAGTTNKILALFAKRVLEGFPSAFSPRAKVMAIGNPVREEMAKLAPPESRLHPHAKLRLLVVGGSLGALALNEIVPEALKLIPESHRPEVWHQTGDKHFDATKKNYERLAIDAKLQPFIDDMSSAYGWADLVLCRAGALTVAELCAVGVGAIFIPFPFAIDDHQTANAQYMVSKDAAICIQQKDLTANRLAEVICHYCETPEERMAMAAAAYQLRKTEVAKRIFDIISEVV